MTIYYLVEMEFPRLDKSQFVRGVGTNRVHLRKSESRQRTLRRLDPIDSFPRPKGEIPEVPGPNRSLDREDHSSLSHQRFQPREHRVNGLWEYKLILKKKMLLKIFYNDFYLFCLYLWSGRLSILGPFLWWEIQWNLKRLVQLFSCFALVPSRRCWLPVAPNQQ